MRYFVEIKNVDGQYQGSIHQGNPNFARSLNDLKLRPDDEVKIKDQTHKLGALVQALIQY
jgi:hypothetical protein